MDKKAKNRVVWDGNQGQGKGEEVDKEEDGGMTEDLMQEQYGQEQQGMEMNGMATQDKEEEKRQTKKKMGG